MSSVIEKLPSQHQTCCIHGDDGLQSLRRHEHGGSVHDERSEQCDSGEPGEASLTLAAVKVNMGRKMMASLASGILVQTAARMVMMAPD